MPQVVACHRCQQQFLAEDRLAGSTVACPSCGAGLTIPAADPSTGASPLQPAIGSFSRQFSADSRQRQRNIALAVVGIVCLVWLIAVIPNVLLWALARPAASYRMVGSGALMFWVGVLAACGGIMEWSFFMNSAKMRATREWFGDQGARWFYVGIGGVIAVLGLGVTVSATAYSFFGTTRRSPERAVFAQRPVAGLPLVGPQVAVQPAAPPPPPGALRRRRAPFGHPTTPSGENSSHQPTVPMADLPPPRVGDDLPGVWRQLEGGYCIKFPAAVAIERDEIHRKPHGTEQHLWGRHHAGDDAVMFSIQVETSQDPRRMRFNHAQVLLDIRAGRIRGDDFGGEVLTLNNLLIVKSESHNSQRDAFGRGPYVLHGTTYRYGDGDVSITVMTYSQLPLDDPAQAALRVYMDTLQRTPLADDAPLADATDRAADAWKLLEGGFRIKLPPALEITMNAISRDERDNSTHRLVGQTADGVRFELLMRQHDSWNFPNEARQNAADHSHNPHPDYEHVAVVINGLLMEKISKRHLGSRYNKGHITFLYHEGQHDITILVWSEFAPAHPSVQTVVGAVESIERVSPEN